MSAQRLFLDDVSVDFGAMRALDHVSLDLRPGEFVSIVGPSGCGKTTLLKIAAGFVTPTRGRATLDGAPIIGPGPERGVIFQEYGVFPWLSVRDNIAFGLKLGANRNEADERDAIVDRYLALMGLAEFRDALPRTLSGGMKQRVALARCYAVRPRILLMDEPFGALDAQTRLVMHDLLLDLQAKERKSVLLVTHSAEEALYLSSRVVVMSARPGRIKAEIDVPFAYPRDRSLLEHPDFAHLRTQLIELVMEEYAAQQRLDRIAV